MQIEDRGEVIQFSLPNGHPPPRDKQFFQLSTAEPHVREAFAAAGGATGGRAALNTLASGVSGRVLAGLSDADVAALNAKWSEFSLR